MLPTLLVLTAAFFLITSNAISIDSPALHLARHHQIAARQPPPVVVKRAAVSAKCKKRNNSTSVAHPPSTSLPASTAAPAPAPAPTTTSQAAPQPSSSPSAGSGKVGIAWAYGDDPSLRNFITKKVSALYTWGPTKPQNTLGLQFAPMIWGWNQLGQFENLVVAGYANIVLGPNEPDIPSQANIDPQTAANLWMAHGQPLRAQGYQTVTPAMAFSKPWMQNFLAACHGCVFDHMAAHVYHTDPQKVIDYLTDLHNTFGMSIWVTEFACDTFEGEAACDEGKVFYFMNTLTQWMDSTPWIDKYFYYGVMTASKININPVNALMNEDGTPTRLGQIYIGTA